MSFLDDLFGGGSARRDAAASFRDSERTRQAGAQQADGIYQKTLEQQLAELSGGTAAAAGNINQGFDAAIGRIGGAVDTARADISGGADRAIATEQDYLARTGNILDPFIERGSRAGEMYEDALGVNGEAAQTGFYDNFQSDPFREYNDRVANNSIINAANAQGRKTSGATDLALSRASLERGAVDMNSRLDRLSGLYDMATQFADRKAGYTTGTGQRIAGYQANEGAQLADTAFQGGQVQAGLDANRGMSLAGNTNQNAVARANAVGNAGQSRADLAYGDAQLSANNRVQLGNANAATRGMGANNLLKIGATAINAFTPGLNGVSAAGNIANTMQSMWGKS